MKNINEVFSDDDFKFLQKVKDKTKGDTWRTVILKWAERYYQIYYQRKGRTGK